MTSSSLFRLSGLSVVIGVVLNILSNLIGAFFYGDMVKLAHDPIYITSNVVNALSSILIVLGLPGVFARQARGFGPPGLIGLILLVVTGLTFPFFFGLVTATVEPFLADKAPALLRGQPAPGFFALFIIGGLSFVIGSVLWAVQLIRRRVEPRWAGFVLIAAAVVEVADVPLPRAANLAISLFGALSGILISIGIGAVAYYTMGVQERVGSAREVAAR